MSKADLLKAFSANMLDKPELGVIQFVSNDPMGELIKRAARLIREDASQTVREVLIDTLIETGVGEIIIHQDYNNDPVAVAGLATMHALYGDIYEEFVSGGRAALAFNTHITLGDEPIKGSEQEGPYAKAIEASAQYKLKLLVHLQQLLREPPTTISQGRDRDSSNIDDLVGFAAQINAAFKQLLQE